MELKELIRETKAQFPIMKVADLLGIRVPKFERTPKGEFYRGDCPFCQKERTFRIEPAMNRYGCFKCAEDKKPDCRGDQLQLVQSVKGFKNVKEACEWLRGGVGGIERRTVQKPRMDRPPRDQTTDGLDAHHPDVEAMGFDPYEARRIGIGYSTKEGAVLLPMRLECGTLVGYVAAQEVIPLDFEFPEPEPQLTDPKIVRLADRRTG